MKSLFSHLQNPLYQQRLRREVLLYTLVVTSAFIVVAILLVGYAIRLYKVDYYNSSLRSNGVLAQRIQQQAEADPTFTVDENVFREMEGFSATVGAYYYLFDERGKCIYVTENAGVDKSRVTLSREIMEKLLRDGKYITDHTIGKFDRSIAEPMLCRGDICTYQNGQGEEVTYFFFVNSFTKELDVFTNRIVLLAVSCVMALSVCAAVIVYRQSWTKYYYLEQFQARVKRHAMLDCSEPILDSSFVGTAMEEIAAYTQNLSDKAQRAEDSSRQFVSNVSHELRTPMTIISGFVDGILDGTIPKDRRMEYLSIVSQEIGRLKMLVNSMLNLTKFDAGTIKINQTMFSLNDLVFRTLMMFTNRIEKREIEIEGLDAQTMRVYADRDLMGQVIFNLVENAVKFVNDHGTISFGFDENESSWIFRIRNTGVGIAKDELPKIFERFYKSDFSRSADKTGLGLGLDITRRILHLHHAQIKVSSEENAYTEFEIQLPKKPD